MVHDPNENGAHDLSDIFTYNAPSPFAGRHIKVKWITHGSWKAGELEGAFDSGIALSSGGLVGKVRVPRADDPTMYILKQFPLSQNWLRQGWLTIVVE
jgi:hypothetical protein